jgi:hypothetical protein
MLRAFIFVSSLFASSMAFAGLDGAWSGWGDWVFQGSGTHCGVMNLTFSENETSLARTAGHFDCDVVGLDVGTQTLQKQNSQLLHDGQVVGSYDAAAGTYAWTEKYSESTKVDITVKVDGHHFDYKELWYGSDGALIYTITGRFFYKE